MCFEQSLTFAPAHLPNVRRVWQHSHSYWPLWWVALGIYINRANQCLMFFLFLSFYIEQCRKNSMEAVNFIDRVLKWPLKRKNELCCWAWHRAAWVQSFGCSVALCSGDYDFQQDCQLSRIDHETHHLRLHTLLCHTSIFSCSEKQLYDW